MGRTARSSVVDKENTPRAGTKSRLRNAKTPVGLGTTPRKALSDLNNLVTSLDPTPMKKKTVRVKITEEKETVAEPVVREKPVDLPVEITSHEVVSLSTSPAEEAVRDVSARPPSYRHLSNKQWEALQLTAGPDDVVFWWRAAEERRVALGELIEENLKMHQQNKELRQELRRLQKKESEASYFSLMARLYALESHTQRP